MPSMESLNALDGMALDCDGFDNGLPDASCAGGAQGPVVFYDRTDRGLTTPFPDDFWTVSDPSPRAPGSGSSWPFPSASRTFSR